MQVWALQLGTVLSFLARRRRTYPSSGFARTASLTFITQQFHKKEEELRKQLLVRNGIATSEFSFNFNGLSDADSALFFRFSKDDVVRMTCVCVA